MKVFFFFLLSLPLPPPVFLTRPVFRINNSSKPLVNLTKLGTGQHMLPQLTFYADKGFLFDLKELLTTGKNT